MLELALELLDLGVGLLEILVEAVSLGNELLFPLAETLLLDLDLLGEALAERLLLLLVLGVVELAWPGLAKLAGLHLLGTVGLVVQLLGGVDKIQHVGSDQDGSKLLEVAVILILDLGHTPRVLAALDDSSIASLDISLGTDDGKGHGSHQGAGVLSGSLIVLLNRGLVDLDVLGLDNSANLQFCELCIHERGSCNCSYLGLELGKIGRAHCVGLGDNGNQVDSRAQSLHDLNVEGLQGVASGSDEVQAGVYTEVDLVISAGLLLLKHVRLVLVVEELDNGHPRISVVDIVAETRGVNDGQPD